MIDVTHFRNILEIESIFVMVTDLFSIDKSQWISQAMFNKRGDEHDEFLKELLSNLYLLDQIQPHELLKRVTKGRLNDFSKPQTYVQAEFMDRLTDMIRWNLNYPLRFAQLEFIIEGMERLLVIYFGAFYEPQYVGMIMDFVKTGEVSVVTTNIISQNLSQKAILIEFRCFFSRSIKAINGYEKQKIINTDIVLMTT